MSKNKRYRQQDTSFEEQEAALRKNKKTPGSTREQENMEEIKKMLQEFQKDIKGELEGIKVEIRANINEVKNDMRELRRLVEESREGMETILGEIEKNKQADGRERERKL